LTVEIEERLGVLDRSEPDQHLLVAARRAAGLLPGR
jgi:hypothetical protein